MKSFPFVLAFLVLLAGTASPSTWYVLPNGTGDAPTIQAGIDSTSPGDTVLLASGIFKGAGNRDLTFRGKAITVLGEGMPEFQVIDCSEEGGGFHRGFLFNSGEGPGSILSGVTIRYGSVPAYGGGIDCSNHSSPTLIGVIFFRNHADVWGGGMATTFSSPELTHCTFQENTSPVGGGLLLRRSSAKLTGVRFIENEGGQGTFEAGGGLVTDSCTVELTRVSFIRNTAWIAGGAQLYLTRARLTDCLFDGNEASYCGGLNAQPVTSLYPDVYVTLENCTFTRNEAILVGGAAVFFDGVRDTVRRSSFVENTANYGGALYLSSSVAFDSCLFDRNTARQKGGAARSELNSTTFRGCVFTRNASADSGGVLHAPLWSQVTFENCTMTNNSAPRGAAVSVSPYPDSWLRMKNTIVSFSGPGEAILCVAPSDCSDITCSDFYGNKGGDGIDWDAWGPEMGENFAADPLFCDTVLGDYTLDRASPCLGAPGCGLVGALGPGCDLVTSVASPSGAAPGSPLLVWSTPNPFNASADVRFSLPSDADVLLSVHDVAGRRVAVLADGAERAGAAARHWDGCDESGLPLPSGIYFIRLRAGGASAVTKAILLR